MKIKTLILLTQYSLVMLAHGKFHAPMILTSEGVAINTVSNGYAAPCIADVDLDGVDELLVGQYTDGNIAIYEINDLTLSKNQIGEKRWLMAGGEKAEVPGIY